MARGHELDARGSAWRDLAWAGGGAAAVILLLVLAVGMVWLLGRTPATTPALLGVDTSTPTPRALSFARATSTPSAKEEENEEATQVAAGMDDTSALALTGAATPELLSATAAEPDGAPPSGPILAAPSDVAFNDIAAGSWRATSDRLVNDGESAVAEPWLKVGTAPGAAYAVEAEMRVTRLLESVCDQSFGLIVGGAGEGQRYGGGLLFPCAGAPPSARLTDVAGWEDGYNADPVIAEKAFDPGDEWHTYRFEVRGERLRLIVDGIGVVAGSSTAATDAAPAETEAGLWSQGVGLEVREIAIVPLPD
jgi:hypothetical protein